MDVIESFDGYKTARRNPMWKRRNNISIKMFKNIYLNDIYYVFYTYISGIVQSVYVVVTRVFKALSGVGSHYTRLINWLYFKAFEALKELKNTPTSQKSHDQV